MVKNSIVVLLFALSSTSFGDELDDAIAKTSQKLNEARQRATEFRSEYQTLNARVEKLESAVFPFPAVCQLRISGTASTPLPTGNNTNERRIRVNAYRGNKVAIYWSGRWKLHSITAEIVLDLNTQTLNANSNYDVFLYQTTAGTLNIELGTAWSTNFVRSVALTKQDGVYVSSADPTRRYIGTIHTNTSGTATTRRYDEANDMKGIYNACQRAPRPIRKVDATDTWLYSATAWREANSANSIGILIGLDEEPIHVIAKGGAISSDGTRRDASIGIGIDSTTVNSAQVMGGSANASTTLDFSMLARYIGHPGIGYHTIYWLESCDGCAGSVNATFIGDNGVAQRTRSGIMAWATM